MTLYMVTMYTTSCRTCLGTTDRMMAVTFYPCPGNKFHLDDRLATLILLIVGRVVRGARVVSFYSDHSPFFSAQPFMEW